MGVQKLLAPKPHAEGTASVVVAACEWPQEQCCGAPTPWRCPGRSTVPARRLRWVPVPPHHSTYSGLCSLPVVPEVPMETPSPQPPPPRLPMLL